MTTSHPTNPPTSYHESNLNAIVEGAWTLMVIDQDDRRTFAWAAGEIDRLRGEVAGLRAALDAIRGRLRLPRREGGDL